MEFGLTDEQRQIREEITRFAENEIVPVAEEHDVEESYPTTSSTRPPRWG